MTGSSPHERRLPGSKRLASHRGRRVALVGEIGGQPQSLPLEVGANLVGSDPSSQVFLSVDGVSRHHAILFFEGSWLEIVDQSSKNGTFVNGSRVRKARIEPGDRIWIGPVELRLEPIDVDDVSLAVEVEGSAGTHELAIPSPGSTCDVWHPGRTSSESWSRLIRLFIRQMMHGSNPERDIDYRRVMAAVGLRGACMLEHPAAGPLIHLGAWGEIRDGLFELVDRRWAARHDRELFDSSPEMTFYSCEVEDHGLSLVLGGDFAGRAECQPMLMALLALFRCTQLDRRITPPAGAPVAAMGRLRFPPGHVRGISEASTELYSQMSRLASAEFPVLVCGETGVGKELVARSLHLSSRRRGGPFVAINCAAIPRDLLEAELFGIGKAIATGVAARDGLFSKAQGGTLLLDEVGEMPLELQAKLLRVLQEREVTPVGGRSFLVDVRVVAATNVEIHELMGRGGFRKDLYYRLAGAVLNIPALRERRSDIPLFIRQFLHRYSEEAGIRVRGITLAAQRALTRHDWPGNVRELQYEMRRLVYACADGQAISSRLLSPSLREHVDATGEPPTVEGTVHATSVALEGLPLPSLRLAELEQLAIEAALHEAKGHQARAAELLGLSRYALQRRLKRRK